MIGHAAYSFVTSVDEVMVDSAQGKNVLGQVGVAADPIGSRSDGWMVVSDKALSSWSGKSYGGTSAYSIAVIGGVTPGRGVSSGDPVRYTLRSAMVHEADHLNGFGHSSTYAVIDGKRHVDSTGHFTPNMMRCSDFRNL